MWGMNLVKIGGAGRLLAATRGQDCPSIRSTKKRPASHCAKPAGVSGSRANRPRDFRLRRDYFFIFGHSHPFSQSLQQSHLQLQFGQSLQHSLEQQVPSLQTAPVVAVVEEPAMLAATIPVASNSPLNNLTNM